MEARAGLLAFFHANNSDNQIREVNLSPSASEGNHLYAVLVSDFT